MDLWLNSVAKSTFWNSPLCPVPRSVSLCCRGCSGATTRQVFPLERQSHVTHLDGASRAAMRDEQIDAPPDYEENGSLAGDRHEGGQRSRRFVASDAAPPRRQRTKGG